MSIPFESNKPSNEQVLSWYPRLFRTALRMTGRPEDAADLTQEALYRALSRWEQFNGDGKKTTWLHSILVNCVRDWARRNKIRQTQPLEPWTAGGAYTASSGCLGHLDHKERMEMVAKAIDDLPLSLRTAFVAVVVDGYSYKQAADLLSAPVGTIGSRVCEARKRVQTVLRNGSE